MFYPTLLPSSLSPKKLVQSLNGLTGRLGPVGLQTIGQCPMAAAIACGIILLIFGGTIAYVPVIAGAQ